jgi:hypothetical protein
MRPVLVIWEDAYDEDGDVWVDPARPVDACYMQTIGFLIHEDKERIALVATVSGAISSRRIVIPAGMVRRIIEIDLSI